MNTSIMNPAATPSAVGAFGRYATLLDDFGALVDLLQKDLIPVTKIHEASPNVPNSPSRPPSSPLAELDSRLESLYRRVQEIRELLDL